MADLSNILVALASGITGGSTALLGQYASQRASRRQHVEDLRQRSVELLASFALPITNRRAEALQQLFTSLQDVLDEQDLTMENYELIRRQLIFVPNHILDDLLPALSALVRSRRDNDVPGLEEAKKKVRAAQQALRAAIGLGSIDSYVYQLNDLRAESEVAS